MVQKCRKCALPLVHDPGYTRGSGYTCDTDGCAHKGKHYAPYDAERFASDVYAAEKAMKNALGALEEVLDGHEGLCFGGDVFVREENVSTFIVELRDTRPWVDRARFVLEGLWSMWRRYEDAIEDGEIDPETGGKPETIKRE